MRLRWCWILLAAQVTAQSVSPPPERVADGLLHLYTFAEGGGVFVRDGSGRPGAVDLVIDDPAAVRWQDDGLEILAPTMLLGLLPALIDFESCRASNELTLEAWVTPRSFGQGGPARVLTMSSDPTARNWTLGQEQDRWDVRLRTTTTGENGAAPSLTSRPVQSSAPALTHLVYTREASGRATLYLNGEPSASASIPGDFSTWDPTLKLALADEFGGERPWLGRYHLVAIYSRALTAGDVKQNQAAGHRPR